MGVSQALKNGLKLAIISGEKSKAIDFLKNKFEQIEVHQGERVKSIVMKGILDRTSLTADEVIYIGDDVNDIECLNLVKHRITVPNANSKVKKLKNIQITSSQGGDGAFREVIDALL